MAAAARERELIIIRRWHETEPPPNFHHRQVKSAQRLYFENFRRIVLLEKNDNVVVVVLTLRKSTELGENSFSIRKRPFWFYEHLWFFFLNFCDTHHSVILEKTGKKYDEQQIIEFSRYRLGYIAPDRDDETFSESATYILGRTCFFQNFQKSHDIEKNQRKNKQLTRSIHE